jgi:signal transduction histidine kinase
LLQQQKNELEHSLNQLSTTQKQLVQAEKMASLGELTAGIAHEIQNPLNFVNNFAEVNTELIDELKKEIEPAGIISANEIIEDIKANSEKITHHGKRADSIVKGMLQHSRKSSGQKEPTDINALCDEYLRLSYHGLRAKDKSFNADFETKFDTALAPINVVPQDIGRVILNLINNAFYAVNERQINEKESGYKPRVILTTSKQGDLVVIEVADNGTGMTEQVKEKIFQPFFTTKPTGEGTGLGLSLSYDIVTKGHGGSINVSTSANQGTVFTIQLPA